MIYYWDKKLKKVWVSWYNKNEKKFDMSSRKKIIWYV